MRKLAKTMLAVGTMVAAATAASSAAAFFGEDFCPYVGAEFQNAWMEARDVNFSTTINGVTVTGANFRSAAPRSFPGFNAFIGGRFCEVWGVEAGFNWAEGRSRSFTTAAGQTFGTGRVNRTGGYLDLVGYYPAGECFNLQGSIGVGYVNVRVGNGFFTSNNRGRGAAVLRVRGGGNWMFTECVGARALVGYESTRSINVGGFRPFRDSVTASVGLFYNF